MIMKKVLFGLMALIGFSCVINAQGNDEAKCYPEVGKPCPDFTLHNIEYYSKKEASVKDFRGKWLILDFWNKGCGACIASFPKIN
jgi:hypothetical protein